MVYLIYGNQIPAIKNRLKRIIKERLDVIDEMTYVRYDGNNVNVKEAVDDANSLPLGYDHKLVALDNCYFLEKPKPRNKIESEQDYQKLKDFIAHPSDESDLVLIATTLSIDKNNEIIKLIEEKGQMVMIPDPDANSWVEGVKKYTRENLGMKIDNDAIYELANRTAGDVALLQNSAIKLSLYTDHVTFEDVVKMVARPLEENTFQIFNFLIQDKNDKALGLYRDLKVMNYEPVTLIGMLANQFRLLNEVSYLSKTGLDNDEIAKELKIKPIRVQILKKNVATVSEKAIKRALEDLFNLDLQIKSGQVDRFYAFELFLINFKRR